ncbi:extracellular dihydrogeodin oxidase/laccase [Colletotrichum godetiae]|uniref:laccase n=1 Tax=Colletotrichum godetiae TaxID=1209918 RepID=A0AAJ0EQP6_9PEZI|nr:extracellular dihydrogeodin oxidase/laccase [Colletotrichum godetiae]KAK1657678.1 extracellular dihydrogeodin oxidase/laccase [Colletotrichum godetiae]
MMVPGKLLATWAIAAITGATAAFSESVASPSSPISSDSSGSPGSGTACVNIPSNRACWTEGFDLSTNYYDEVPDTGVVREYWFNVENGTASPDGYEMPVQLINGSFPGPTIIADWGDTVVVHLTNSLQTNGTGLHFHGIRQNWTDQMDGVPSITQCPIAPNDTYTYQWRAVEYGTGWYHSHFYVQAWDGVFGGITINGPASANYDVDLGHLFLNDWYHQTADELVTKAATGGPPTAVNGLINGTNTFNDTMGSRFETVFEAGTRYRLRLVNAAADNHFRFMIDNHTMEIIATDFVPIVPYNATQLSIGMGQRYDIIVEAKDLTDGDFWLRSIAQESCSESDAVDNVKGIIRYSNSSTSDPTTSAYSYTDSCLDEASSNLVPYLPINASDTYISADEKVAVEVTDNALLWTMNKTSMHTQWEYPTAMQISQKNSTWLTKQNVIHLPDADKWVYMVIHSPFAQDHPMHLHGHDFWVLDSGYGNFDSNQTDRLALVNAPRRDVAMMPGSGYLVIAFKTNNPGAWLMHCHIAWHTSEGFAVQIVERESEITYDTDVLNQTCTNWMNYVVQSDLNQYDSGV